MNDHPHIDAQAANDAEIDAMLAEIQAQDAERPAAPRTVETLATATVSGDGIEYRHEVRRVGHVVLHVGSTTCSKPTADADRDALRAKGRRLADHRAAHRLAPARPRSAARVPVCRARTSARARGAGRPRASAVRSSSRSGDGDGSGSTEGSGDPDPSPPRSSTLSLRAARAHIAVDLIAAGRARGVADVGRLLGWTALAAQLAVTDGLHDGRLVVDAGGALRLGRAAA